MLQRPAADEFAPFYAGYVARVPAGDLVAILRDQFETTAALFSGLSEDRAAFRYAPGKWSVKQVIGHLADAERVLAYRMLRFARADATPLPGFEENAWAESAASDVRDLDDLVDELLAVRRATLALMEGLPEEAWTREGIANDARVTVRAMACIITGHELHHREILKTRYGL